jgi:DNA-binding NarL/FixJ family response regulator
MGIHAPIIVATAFADVEKVKYALNLGAAYFIEKPFRASELIAEMRRLLATPHDPTYAIERGLAKVGLTPKEHAVIRLLLKGLTAAEIARLEGNSDKTIRQHVTQIYSKCGVTSRAELFHYLFPS